MNVSHLPNFKAFPVTLDGSGISFFFEMIFFSESLREAYLGLCLTYMIERFSENSSRLHRTTTSEKALHWRCLIGF